MTRRVYDLNEREATRRYTRTLKQICQEEGLLRGLAYEVKSTLYSMGKRLTNLFDKSPSYSDAELHHNEAKRHEALAHDERLRHRKAERHGYILRREEDMRRRYLSVASIFGILSGLLLLSPNITGSVIVGLPPGATNSVGAILLFAGLLGAALWQRNSDSMKPLVKGDDNSRLEMGGFALSSVA